MSEMTDDDLQRWVRSVHAYTTTGVSDGLRMRVMFPIAGLTDAEIAERTKLLGEFVAALADYYHAETGDTLDVQKFLDVRVLGTASEMEEAG